MKISSDWNVPIYIPTRGGSSIQRTWKNLPEELKKFVIFYSSEKITEDISPSRELVTGNIGIASKRQKILDDSKESFIMADDDLSFKAFIDNKQRNPILDNFIQFQDFCLSCKDTGLIATHPTYFPPRDREYTYGLGDFTFHNKNLVRDFKYDRVAQFEDIDFGIQCICNGIPVIKSLLLLNSNKSGEQSDTVSSRGDILEFWANESQHLIKLTPDVESIIANKKVPHKIKIYWSKVKRI